jgi:hypothetical protein
MFCFWIFVLKRNFIFNIFYIILKKPLPYKKSLKVDIGFSVIIASIIFSVIIFANFQFISIEILLLLIIVGSFFGGIIIALGLKSEWRDNYYK